MKQLILAFFLCASASAQQWAKVADETTKGAVTLPAGSIYRYGTDTGVTTLGADCSKVSCFAQVKLDKETSFASLYFPDGALGTVDPAPGLLKSLYVLQTPTVQSVMVGTSSVPVAAAVPTGPIPTAYGTYALKGCSFEYTSDGKATILPGCQVVKQ
jgi:hypothetical protein